MLKKITTVALLFTVLSTQLLNAADQHYWLYDSQNPDKLKKQMDSLYEYVEQENIQALSQLSLNMEDWGKNGCPGDYQYIKIKDWIINHVYEDFIKEKNESAVKIMLPLARQLGHSPLWRLRKARDHEMVMTARWLVNIASQVPGIMITELEDSCESEILALWPLMSSETQTRIIREAEEVYEKAYPKTSILIFSGDQLIDLKEYTVESFNEQRFRSRLENIRDAHKIFKLLCTVIPQELKEQEATQKKVT